MAGRNEVVGRAPRIRDRLLAGLLASLVFVFERLPIDFSTRLGASFGRAWFRLAAPRTRLVRDQLAAALPDADVDVRERWARDVFSHLGRGLSELIVLRGRRREELLDRVRVEGLENLESAERWTEAGGVLIVTAHIGNWELACARVTQLGKPISVVYRRRGGAAIDEALLGIRGAGSPQARQATGLEGIPMDGRAGIRVARALAEGRWVIVALDQNARRHEGVFVRFFGQPACTRSGPLAIASLRGVPVLTAFIRREENGRDHRLRIDPPLQLEPGASDDEEVLRRNVQRVTAAIEAEIRASPGQWIWTHRRWRTRPAEKQPSA